MNDTWYWTRRYFMNDDSIYDDWDDVLLIMSRFIINNVS